MASIAALASLASTAALPADTKQLTTRDACSSSLYANTLTIGGAGGGNFCESRIGSSGEVISSLEVWSDGTGIRGILFTYSRGQAMMHGIKFGDTNKAIKFDPGEKVRAATLWGNGKGQHLGHIYLKTDKQEFDVGMNKPNKGYDIDVGGGLLLGASGGSGEYIDRLAFLFLPPNFSSTDTFGGSVGIEISAEVVGIGAKATGGFEWGVSDTTSKSTMISDTITLTQTVGPISIAPGHGKACQIFAQKGNGSFPYSSTVTLKLDNGRSIAYQEKGKLLSVQYSQVQSSCVDADNPADWDSTTDHPPAGVQIVGKNSSR
ncbi:MAG: hypothetical protein Q9184_003847 [Pyrenodesmia sp. 2 TL-2023]